MPPDIRSTFSGGRHADGRRKRSADPRRGRRADGPADAPALDAGLPGRGGRRAGRHAVARRGAGHAHGRLPRQRRPARPARREMPAPRRFPAARPQRGMRSALPLPRLEIRRGRQVRCHGLGARERRPDGQGQGAGLSGRRVGRFRLGVARRTRRRPTFRSSPLRPAGLRSARRRRYRDPENPRAVQLGADPRGPDRQRPILPACIRPTWCRPG